MFLIPIDRNSCGPKSFRESTKWAGKLRGDEATSHGISGFGVIGLFLWYAVIENTPKLQVELCILFWECYCRSQKKTTAVQIHTCKPCKKSLGYYPTKGFMALNPVAIFHPLLSVSNAWKACAAATCTCTGSTMNALEILTMRAQAYRLKQLRDG